MSDRTAFQALQFAFAAHIRDPDTKPAPPDIEDRRMAVYRDLFFKNLSSLLGGTYPVLKKILPDARWAELIRSFMRDYRAHTPLFLEVPREFLEFLQQNYEASAEDPPFLLELAHYEWVELALSVEDTSTDASGLERPGDVLAGAPVLSPLAWRLAYRFPVHRIGPDYLPEKPGDTATWLVVNRRLDDTVGFHEINAVTARLMELIESSPDITGGEHLKRLAGELGQDNSDTLIAAGREILLDLYRNDIVLGTRPA
jgi:hypothetical protein